MELSDAPEKIDPGTLRLVAQCLNHYVTPGPFSLLLIILTFISLLPLYKYLLKLVRRTIL